MLFAALAAGPAAHAAAAASDAAVVRVEAREQTQPTTEGLAKAGKLPASNAHAVHLPPPAAGEVEAHTVPPGKGIPLQIGFARPVSDLATEMATHSALVWQQQPDGSNVADLSVSSSGAAAVRVGLRIGNLPDAAVIRFQGPNDSSYFDTTGQKVNEAIARNGRSGDTSDDGRTYWSPMIDGDTVLVELQLPAGTSPNTVRLAVPKIGHMFTSAAKDFVLPTKSASYCEIDAMCSTGWANQMNAVAKMVFTDGVGHWFACTGTLLADQDTSTNKPYFLSANHCINTQSEATSLTTYWFYRSTACNSGTVGPYVQLSGGATLLYNSASTDPTYTDTSFMLLASTPPQGTYFAGWSVNTPGIGAAITGLHHPGGDLLKISQGGINGYLSCTAPSSGNFNCTGPFNQASTSYGFYDIGWGSGITEPGSSGSGLFNNSGYLVGQLYGGSGNCTTPGDDAYGRFDLAYNNALKQWLSPPLTLTVTKSGAGSGTVTSSPAGISCGSTCSGSFAYGSSVSLAPSAVAGSVFTGWGGACSGTGSCTVPMNSSQSVSASFAISTWTLAVGVTGAGSVASAPSGISCGTTCSASFNSGTSVTLTPTPAAGYYFSGWTGACSGTGSCVVTATSTASVGATFTVKGTPTTALTTSLNPSLVGASIVLTANVSGAIGTPTGSVTFNVDGSAPSGCWSVALASGTASCTVSTLTVGAHSIIASYSGDSFYNAAMSATVTQNVSPAGTVQISAPTQLGMGGESMGTTSPVQSLTITNSGAAPVSFTGITISGPFTESDNCTSIAPMATCTVNVVFNPPITQGAINSTVAASGSLTLTSNGANSPFVISLSGTAEDSLITHYYQSILRRNPDASGKSFWQGEAVRMVKDGVDVNETWYAMAMQFFAGTEYASLNRDDTGFVTDLYDTFFNRPPDASGLSYWTGLIAQGMPREVVLVSFLFSNEFTTFTQSIFGTTTVRAEINTVTDFYRGLLGRLPDDSGFAYWLQQFRTAQCQGASAVAAQANSISYAFTTSAEYANRNRTNAQYVGDMYDTFLRRGGDAAGVQYWLGQLNSGAMTRDQVRQAFLTTPEFQSRVNAVVAQGCF